MTSLSQVRATVVRHVCLSRSPTRVTECTDFRKLNSVTKTDTFPIPRIDDSIDKVGKAKYEKKINLLK